MILKVRFTFGVTDEFNPDEDNLMLNEDQMEKSPGKCLYNQSLNDIK